MKPQLLSLASLLFLCVVSSSWGGGSVGWAFHALPILKKYPDLLALIETSLDVRDVGGGVRLGKDFGDEQGKRIPPFEFPARLKGSTGPYTLLLIIHDPSGVEEEGTRGTWLEIRPIKPLQP